MSLTWRSEWSMTWDWGPLSAGDTLEPPHRPSGAVSPPADKLPGLAELRYAAARLRALLGDARLPELGTFSRDRWVEHLTPKLPPP